MKASEIWMQTEALLYLGLVSLCWCLICNAESPPPSPEPQSSGLEAPIVTCNVVASSAEDGTVIVVPGVPA